MRPWFLVFAIFEELSGLLHTIQHENGDLTIGLTTKRLFSRRM